MKSRIRLRSLLRPAGPLSFLAWAAPVLVLVTLVFWYSRPADVNLEDPAVVLPHQAHSRFATIDGVRMHYQEKGEGPKLVLLHGFGSSTFTWKDVLDPLSTRFSVIAVDLMGFGFSEKPDTDYTVHRQAELVMKLLDQLNVERAMLCGNSMGGAVAIACAAADPDRVSSLVLLNSVAYADLDARSFLPSRRLLMPVAGESIAALVALDDRFVAEGLKVCLYDPQKVTRDRVEAYGRPFRTRHGQRAVLQTLRNWDLSRIEAAIPSLKQPVLLIWGADDRLVPLPSGARLHRDLPGSKWVVLSHCGHLPQEEYPARVAEEIMKFGTELETTGRLP
ncbi:MAG: alpha/beta hydrolase [Acidobacteria bacterium]|nr:alpha/beta hydrolase [Acidobacteriota bacterium]